MALGSVESCNAEATQRVASWCCGLPRCRLTSVNGSSASASGVSGGQAMAGAFEVEPLRSASFSKPAMVSRPGQPVSPTEYQEPRADEPEVKPEVDHLTDHRHALSVPNVELGSGAGRKLVLDDLDARAVAPHFEPFLMLPIRRMSARCVGQARCHPR